MIGHRRRVEEEGEDEGHGQVDVLDDDSLTEGSIASDEQERDNDSDTSNIDEASPTSPTLTKKSVENGAPKSGSRGQPDKPDIGSASAKPAQASVSDTQIMLNGLSISGPAAPVEEEITFGDTSEPKPRESAPAVVSSSQAALPQKRESTFDRQRREHDLYRQRRDEDPSFVPNRGAFFMHDHRGAGPSANGFRPFPRGARGRGRGGFGGPFAPIQYVHPLPVAAVGQLC